MFSCLSVDNMRKSDMRTIETKTPSIELMERAAYAVFEELDIDKKIYIISGSGNNGGDGIALCKILIERGKSPYLFLASDKLSNDSKYFLDRIKGYKNIFDVSVCDYNADIIVDCLLGTGFHGDVSSELEKTITNINNSNAYVVSVDIPSGLNGNNGIAKCAIKADETIAIQFAKYGHYLNDAKDYVGVLKIKDIEIEQFENDAFVIEEKDIEFPHRLNNTNKATYGKAIIIGGCQNYYGAVKIANMGVSTLRVGAGLNVLAVPKSMTPVLGASIIESTLYPLSEKDGQIVFVKEEMDKLIKSASAFAIGMGMGQSEENKKIIEYLINNFSGPVLIDADGLNSLNGDVGLLKNAKAKIILTPHPKEMSRLANKSIEDIINNPVNFLKELIGESNLVVLLKGATTIVASKDNIYFMPYGSPSLAKGGSGDTLSGVILGLISQGFDLVKSCYMGAYLCAKAAKKAEEEYSEYGVLASDVAKEIARIYK